MASKKQQNPIVFKVGDKVQWTSSAAGTTATKEGKVVLVVEAGRGSAREVEHFLRNNRKTHVSKYGGGWDRYETSYVVEVSGSTKNSKPKLYWPVASLLRKGWAPRG